MHYIFLIVLLPFIALASALLKAVISVINAIIDAVNSLIPGPGPIAKEPDPEFANIEAKVFGCGKYHIAPVIREIMQYHTGKCGLTFQSSILINDPLYSNSALLQAQNEKGQNFTNGSFNWIDDNRWNVSCTDVLSKISLLHNADYRIIGGKLIYERKDHFLTVFAPAEVNLIDFCTDGTIDRFEYSIIKGGKAYGKFEYQKDAVDTEGNRLITDYNDIVDWNDPVQEHLSGEYLVANEFSPARFMFDRKTQEKENFFDYDKSVDKKRAPRDKDLILTANTSLNIKVLALEQNTPRNDAKTIRRKRGTTDGIDYYDYNWPYYYDANYVNPELYQRFHFIDDPNLNHGAYYQVEGNVTILLTKQLAQDILQYGTDLKVITHLGNGKGDSFLIDREKKQVVISGIKIPCVQ